MTDNDLAAEAADSSSNELDVIYQNMRVTYNFRTLRQKRFRTVEQQLQILTHQIQVGCFDTIKSISASGSFVVVIETLLLKDELF